MLKIDYSDWYINQKRLPDIESAEYEAFYEFHKKLATEGFMMGDTYFNPFLYWHLNFWHTSISEQDEQGRIYEKYGHPTLRDNEWIVTNEIHRAEMEHKGLAIFGIRRFSKTTLESSYLSWGATFDENSQNIIAGLNSQDIKLVTDMIDKGLNRIPEAWKWQRIEDNWKNQVTFGIKTKDNTRIPFSAILIRNLDDGNNQEAIAGTKPRKLIIDEGGKGSFLKGLQAAIPGFTTPFGWGCSPIVTGTGGDMKKFLDAKSLFFDVEKYNFLSYNNEKDTRRVHGLFISNKYRLEAKDPSTLDIYLGKEDPVLAQVPIMVSNEEKATLITTASLDTLKRAGDRHAYLKEKMYYPFEVDDIFLNEDTNIFNTFSARAQQQRLKDNEITGSTVFLEHDGETIVHRFVDSKPIAEFPRVTGSKDAPIVIWEMPMKDPPFGLYVAGVDPYRHASSKYSDSLGAVYIFKRMHDINSEHFQDTFVAAYVARPDDKDKWNEQARLLIKYYNARTLCENDEMSFIEYMKAQGDARYLEKQPPWLKEIVPNTQTNREFGIHRSSSRIIEHLHGCLKTYLNQKLDTQRDENGSIISETLGVYQVRDPMLLEEVINFNEEGNFDRIIAAELAIAMAFHLDPIIKVSSIEEDPRFKSLFNKAKRNKASLFDEGRTLFSNNNKNKLFL